MLADIGASLRIKTWRIKVDGQTDVKVEIVIQMQL